MLPVRHCAQELLERGIRLELCTDLLRADKADAILVHRILKGHGLTHLCAMKADGTRVLWDVDDALDIIPPWSPVRYDESELELYKAGYGVSDERWFSTEELLHQCNNYKRQPYEGEPKVLPNLIDTDQYDEVQRPPVPPNRKVQVLWFGSATHREDIRLLELAVRETLHKYKDRVKFTFWGDCPANLLKEYAGGPVQLIGSVPLGEFFARMVSYQPDIVLCPLADHPFNNCKSNIKWLEASLCGAATIVSSCPVYAAVEDGVTGVVASDDEWAQKIALLIEDVEGRKTIAKQAETVVREDWSWGGSQKELWFNAFTKAVEEQE